MKPRGGNQIQKEWVIDPTVAPTEVTVSNATATSAQLDSGRYIISCTCDVYVKAGGSTITAATTDTLLYAGAYMEIPVLGNDDDYVAAITSAADGTLQIFKMKRVFA